MAWAGSAFLFTFFAAILTFDAYNPVNQFGAILGLLGSLCPAGYVIALARREPAGTPVPCVRAYEMQLSRQRDAINMSTVTILLIMVGAGLLAVPTGAGLRQALLSVAGPWLGGLVTAWFLWASSRRYGKRIGDLRRLYN